MTTEQRLLADFDALHAMPETGFHEFRTSAWLARRAAEAGFRVATGVAGTGVVAVLEGAGPGPTVALRADMDALAHQIEGREAAVHSCGHDAHCAMVLAAAEDLARAGLARGVLKILFQPGEETLYGAARMIEAGVLEGVDALIGIHLRPIREARTGQATPALQHGAATIMQAVLHGRPAHGARPHMGVNAIDAAAAVVNAVNAVYIDPAVPWSCKVTRLHAGGTSANVIPDWAELALDLRAQRNDAMRALIQRVEHAVRAAAATVGATAEITTPAGVPAAEYAPELVDLAREAIRAVLGEQGLLPPVVTPGGDDFHEYAQARPGLKTAFVGLGCDLAPGLHDPGMGFDRSALVHGCDILEHMVRGLLGRP
jgi:amidohydrolase